MGENSMKRVIGFAAFFVAVGITIGIFLPSSFARIVSILVCLLIGYQFFCC